MSSPLETPRLRLRLPTPADADFVCELVNEPAWLHYIGDRGVRTRADAEHYLEKHLALHRLHGIGLLAVELKNEGPIGLCGLLKRDFLPAPDLGFAFLSRVHGRGFGFEAAGAVVRFGQSSLGFSRLLALTHPENAPSITLLRKLGFQLKSRFFQPGAVEESLVFALTSSPANPT